MNLPTNSDPFSGGGEVGALMRSMDWSKTTLGPVSEWSQALRTMVGLLLRNRHPILLWWGPHYAQLYNDAYRPILGAKHPKSVGQPASECWPEIWNVIGPMIDAPFSGKPATGAEDLLLILDRKGFFEEAYFSVTYSPVPDESIETSIGGVLATVVDTTRQVFAERQLKTLHDLGARTAEAKTPEQACEAASITFGENSLDVPFCLFYLLNKNGDQARLVAECGFGPEHDSTAKPAVIDLNSLVTAKTGWELSPDTLGRTAHVFSDLRERFGALPKGNWLESPHHGILLPLTSPNQEHPYGVLIIGVNPYRQLDDGYQIFLELAAAQIVTSIRNARAYEEERLRAEKLAEIDRAKTAFFSNVSHEFRTPLTLMLGPLEDNLADLSGSPSPRHRERDELAYRNSLRLLKLVNSLLDFSRIEAGRVNAVYRPTDLSKLTAELSSVFRAAIEKAGLKLTVDISELGEAVYVDRDMWEKIVLNLLSNAFKFTFNGEIEVKLTKLTEKVCLSVRDTGIGVHKTELSRIFERFHRVEGAQGRTHEGTGIGLALIQELVKLHGGSVSVESQFGVGTEFKVEIPFGKGHLPMEHIQGESRTAPVGTLGNAFVEEALRWLPASKMDVINVAATPQSDGTLLIRNEGPRARVLLADDNADMRGYLQNLLQSHWDVETVGDGEAALISALKNPPDLVLTDVMMPKVNGLELLQSLKQNPMTQNIPVILLSARAGEESRIEGLQAGADDYLMKPFSAKELLARIRTHLQIGKLRIEAVEQALRMNSIFMQAPVAICVLDGPEHIFTLSNPLYDQLVKRDVLGKKVRDAFTEAEGGPFFTILDRIYQTGEPYISNESLAPLVDSNGKARDRYIDFTYNPLRDSQGHITSILALLIDVTDRVFSQNVLEDSQEQLRAAIQIKDDFIATLSHELRTPITSILSWSQLIQKMKLDPDKIAHGIKVIEQSAKTQTQLTDDLLDITRIQSGKFSINFTEISPSEPVLSSIEAVRPLADDKQIIIELQIKTQSEKIWADSDRLQQVMRNLLTNAVKFSSKGGVVRVLVEAKDEQGDRFVSISVIDLGKGLSPEFLPKLFERFSQADSSSVRVHGGLGLGLAIVRDLVTLQGGSVRAESEGLGKGATFTVLLPIKTVSSGSTSEVTSFKEIKIQRDAPANLSGLNVMIVEDDPKSLEVLSETLGHFGAKTLPYSTVREALAAFEKLKPDVLVSDISMPIEDGYSFIQKVRKLGPERGGNVPALALTALATPEDAQRALLAGFDSHMAKPFDMIRLGHVVAAFAKQCKDARC